MLDVVVVGAGPNGLAAALTCAEAGRSRARARGGRHDRRRHPHGRADAARASATTCARPSTRWPPCRRSSRPPASSATASSCCSRRWRWSTRSTAAGPGCCTSRWPRPSPASASTARPGTATSAGRPGAGTPSAPTRLGPLLRVPRAPVHAGRLRRPGRCCRPPGPVGPSAPRRPRACFAGCAAHAFLPLSRPLTTAMGLMLLASAHVAGWPVGQGRLAGDRRRHGRAAASSSAARSRPAARCGRWPTSRRRRRCCSTSPPASCSPSAATSSRPATAGGSGRFRYGPGVFKVDYALSEPVPWTNADCPAGRHAAPRRHARRDRGGRGRGRPPAATPTGPFVLVGQQSLVDPTRAPAGQHTLWTYCHVPNGSDVDMTDAIERADRAVRAGVPRRRARPPRRPTARWYEALQPQLHRRRHRRRVPRRAPARAAPAPRRAPLPHAEPAVLPLLGVHAARAAACTACAACTPPRRRSRHVLR